MKKKFLLFTFFLGFVSFGFSQECKEYKNGTFKLEDKELGVTYIIKRKGNIQTERKLGEDKGLDFEVIWIDDCTYILKSTPETSLFLKTEVDLVVQIKNVKGNYLELEMHMKDHDFETTKMTTFVEVIN
ncbi:hypothetical protein [Flavobacterium sp. J27]|uniref:hypothetical protein n=1 Tax=Flavobacterium sp. J27 TaxID=2060419 RepID=UPI001030F3F8|nr:hypothetical protein [Flavobacterium sp. J27]